VASGGCLYSRIAEKGSPRKLSFRHCPILGNLGACEEPKRLAPALFATTSIFRRCFGYQLEFAQRALELRVRFFGRDAPGEDRGVIALFGPHDGLGDVGVLEIALLREEQSAIDLNLAEMESMAAQELLSGLSSQLNNVWNDMLQFPITYYFASSDRQSTLSVGMPYLLLLAQEGANTSCSPEVRLRASMLLGKIHTFTVLLTRNFIDLPPTASAKEVLEAYAHDHLHSVLE
jgi:hypothetical protein